MSNYTNNIEQNNFYFNGFVEKDIEETIATSKLIEFIKKSDLEDLSLDQNWIESYEKTYDLNQDKIIENNFFIDFLNDQNIPQFLEMITGNQLFLGDIVLRKTFLRERSYMDWHRDTYLKEEKAVGRTPPLIKIIFYPNIGDKKSLELEIIQGSHLLYFKNKFIQKIQQYLSNKIKIYSSNSKFLIFNSAIMHAAKCPDEDGAFRLIYNFCTKSQLSQFPNSKQIHEKFLKITL